MSTRRNFLKQTGAVLGYGSLFQAGIPLFAQNTPANPSFSPSTYMGAASLAARAARTRLPYGCAVVPEMLNVEMDYTRTIIEQCSILVAENSMKWAAIHPQPNTFNFAGADKLLAFAGEHKMQLRGHNLCWHQALPSWFTKTMNRGNAKAMLVQHIQTVAGRYAGKLHSWDVVNEAIHVQDGRPDGLRKSPWLELIGEEYIDIAFHTARQADPHALLTYNDYGIEYDVPHDDQKRAAVLSLLRRMRKRKTPIDAVGVQSHLRAGTQDTIGDGLEHFLQEVRKLDLQVFITEMDVDDSHLTGDADQREAAVAAVYKQYFDLMLRDSQVTAALTWGITNRYTWLNHEHPRKNGDYQVPLPFDSNYQPAKAFFALGEAFGRRKVQSAAPVLTAKVNDAQAI